MEIDYDMILTLKQELLVTVIIFILLFLKIAKDISNQRLIHITYFMLAVNFVAGLVMNAYGDLFSGMFHQDALTAMEKNILSAGTLLISLQSYHWLKDHDHLPEFFILLLSTLLGMYFMISSGNLLLFFIGLELSTIPLAALVNFDLARRRSSEAAMKLIISSAFSSGLLLFGISMIYGLTGTLSFHELATHLSYSPLMLFGIILLITGFAFKISAVPFHFWTADVYEGAPVAVTSYLSVISKGAVLFVFVSVLYKVFAQFADFWYNIIACLSVFTILAGNLFALRQQNIKRFLAFSSIAQVGFILVGITANSIQGSASVVFFILVYVFSNLGAFGVVALVSHATGKENITDFNSFYKTNPVLSWVLALSLFSLAGVPPLAGFFGKFFLLLAGAGNDNYPLIIFAALNMVISMYYYLRIVKAIFMDPNEEPVQKIELQFYPAVAMIICIAGILITGLWSWFYQGIYSLSEVYAGF
jgi:NADH-quinone oxidoreductase subunit N